MTDNNPGTMVCVNHPNRETYLRCNRCERPICSSCAVLTPTGYRCRDCVRGQQKTFETAATFDPYLAGGIALVISLAGSFVAAVMGFFTLIIAPIVGMIVAETVRWAVRRRRSRALFLGAAIGAGLGALPLVGFNLVAMLALVGMPGFGVTDILGLVWQGLYAFLVVSTVYYRLSGIQL